MKEFEMPVKDTLEVSAVKPIIKELKLIGSLKPKGGHTCFQLDLSSGKIIIAEFEKIDVDFLKAANGDYSKKKKLIIQPNCIYATALNLVNVKKKFIKMLIDLKLRHQQ